MKINVTFVLSSDTGRSEGEVEIENSQDAFKKAVKKRLIAAKNTTFVRVNRIYSKQIKVGDYGPCGGIGGLGGVNKWHSFDNLPETFPEANGVYYLSV